jgi:hypothetical protein
MLQRLVFAVRDTLQKLHDKVSVKRLACRFHHGIVRKRDRVVCRKEQLASLNSKLVCSMGECAGFLSNAAWANCMVDISALHDLLPKTIEDMESESKIQKARRDRGADDVHERLANARIIEAAIDMPALCAPLSLLLHEQGCHQPHFVSAEAIDKWNPMPQDGEMQAAARKRRQRFWANMQLTCAASSFEHHHGGQHSVTLVLWRHPAQSDRTSMCQLKAEAEVIKGPPCCLSDE